MAEYEQRPWLASLTPGRRLALLIATGIGLHNFGEGLAIGQSAASGEIALALTLIIGSACTTPPRDSGSSGRWQARPNGRAGGSSRFWD